MPGARLKEGRKFGIEKMAGCWTAIRFILSDDNQKIICQYNLEKKRVLEQAPQEQPIHVNDKFHVEHLTLISNKPPLSFVMLARKGPAARV